MGGQTRHIWLREPFALSRIRQGGHAIGRKPHGLWFSPGSEWQDWVLKEWDHHRLGQHSYKVDLDFDRILRIETLAQLQAFTAEYGLPYMNLTDDGTISHVDWNEVARRYGGIEIAPYQPQYRMFEECWYAPWDVASGCVWDLNVIQSVTLT